MNGDGNLSILNERFYFLHINYTCSFIGNRFRKAYNFKFEYLTSLSYLLSLKAYYFT